MKSALRLGIACGLVGIALSNSDPQAADQATPQVVQSFPHDTGAFTQGLLFHEGVFYESTGLYGQSSLRRVDPQTGVVLFKRDLARSYFAEGLARVGDELIQLTWQENTAFIHEQSTFEPLGTYGYSGQGWGLCHDGKRLVMSNGSSLLTFRDPDTFSSQGQVQVTLDGLRVGNLNELECVGSLIYANVWLTDTILRIDAATGEVLTEIDASDLLTPQEEIQADVLNGIAFDPVTEHFYLTGKLWPRVFEVAFEFNPYGPGCHVAGLQEVGGVLLDKVEETGVSLRWLPDRAATEYHVNSVDSLEFAPPPGPHRIDLPGGQGTPQCDALDGSISCTDVDGQIDPGALLLYQVYAACGNLGQDEGPP